MVEMITYFSYLSAPPQSSILRAYIDINAYFLHFPFILDKTVVGDSLSYHHGFEFGTFDKYFLKCASEYGGGWWYNPKDKKECVVNSNLNAVYNRNISWGMLDPANAKGSHPKTTEMKIRPMNFSSNTFTH